MQEKAWVGELVNTDGNFRGCSFVTMLRNTGWEMAIDLFTLVLLESRIVFHSLRPSVLTTIMETLCAAMFPLHWTGTYIPRCAREMVTSAECPGCALIGQLIFSVEYGRRIFGDNSKRRKEFL